MSTSDLTLRTPYDRSGAARLHRPFARRPLPGRGALRQVGHGRSPSSPRSRFWTWTRDVRRNTGHGRLAAGRGLRCRVSGAGGRPSDGFKLLDPAIGRLADPGSAAMGGLDLPAPLATFPPEIVQASRGSLRRRAVLIGVAGDRGPGSPEDGRTSVSTWRPARWGSPGSPRRRRWGRAWSAWTATAGPFWRAGRCSTTAPFCWRSSPTPQGELNVGSHAFDWARSLIYAQVPEATGG